MEDRSTIIALGVIVGSLVLLAVMFRLIYVRSRARSYERWKQDLVRQFRMHLVGCTIEIYLDRTRAQLIGQIWMNIYERYDEKHVKGSIIVIYPKEVNFGRHLATVKLKSGGTLRRLDFNGRAVKVPGVLPHEIASFQFDVRRDGEPT